MKRFSESCWLRSLALVVAVLAVSGLATAATQYVVTNDDSVFPFHTGVSFYTMGSNGLVFQQQVQTGNFGIGGGYFGMNRVAVLNSAEQQCVYASEAGNDDVVGIVISTLTVGGSASGSSTDGGTTNGIGLAMNSNYLYASFSDSNTIGTFQVEPGCGLTFVNDTSVVGLQSGVINGMAVHGSMLIASYTDGSIESFNISGGSPVSNGDKQYSTATVKSQDATYANSIDITSDGHFAIFGDTSTQVSIEVSDISSGKLTKTKTYQSLASISSSNIILSPDETVLYAINTQGDTVSAFSFDKATGVVSPGCRSGRLRGISQNWSYLAGVALISQTGTGGGVYVAEFGSVSGIATVTLTTSGKTCSLQEASGSPLSDPNSPGLLSIGTFPPRSF
ncbi:MAG: beta-propeller fold lactonase family protein [Candidatus Sulfotelmatobacter sp.]